MTCEYAAGTEGYSLPLCRSSASNPDLEESMNSLQFSSFYSIHRASIKSEMFKFKYS